MTDYEDPFVTEVRKAGNLERLALNIVTGAIFSVVAFVPYSVQAGHCNDLREQARIYEKQAAERILNATERYKAVKPTGNSVTDVANQIGPLTDALTIGIIEAVEYKRRLNEILDCLKEDLDKK